jgi:hypothetical protein
VVYDSMQGSSLAHGSGQWSFGAFPLGRPPDRGLEHTLDLRLPRIGEWMGEPRGATYTLIVKLRRRCQQMRIREPNTCKSIPRYHQGILVMPLGLTNTLVTLQSCRQLSRHLSLWFDALRKTWEDYQSQLGETGSLVVMAESIHWDLVIRVQGAQWESQILFELCTEFSAANIGSSRLPMRWWDPSIHQGNRLLRMRLTTDRPKVVMDPHRDGDEVRGVVEFCFSPMIPKIEDSHGLTGIDFTEMSWPRMVHDKEFQERRAQSEHGGQTVVIGGMHHQHDGSSRRLAWDLEIVVVDRSTVNTDGTASLRSPEFTLGVRRISSLEEQSSKELRSLSGKGDELLCC